MASSPSGSVISTGSTSSSFPVIQPQSQIISSKLTENNFLIWRQQVLAAVRGYGLEGYLSGETSAPSKFTKDAETHLLSINPEYLAFQRQDQLLASWLLSSLSDSILALMVGLDSVAEMWQTLETNFSSHSQARQMQYKLQLSTMKKGNQSMREFISKVKLCCDALAAAGHKVKDCDQLMHICAGLGSEYDPIVCAITSKHEPYSLSDASALLLSFEARLEATNTVTTDENHNIVVVNLAVQGNKKEGNHSSTQNYRGRGFQQRGGRSGRYRGRGGRFQNNGRQACQICHYTNHTADKCYYRADLNFTPNNQQHSSNMFRNTRGGPPTAMVASQDVVSVPDSSWFPDSGATNHVTYDLSNLNIATEYQGNNRLHMGNGTGSQYGGSSTPRET